MSILKWFVLIVTTSSTAFADYTPGYIWNRQANWFGGMGDGSATGNPNLDGNGNPTWLYVSRGGTGLSGANPWWKSSSSGVMGSFSQGNNRWIAGNAYCLHDVFFHEFGNPNSAPAVEWLNPTRRPVLLRITGLVSFGYELGSNQPIEYAIGRYDTRTNDGSLLYSSTIPVAAGQSRSINASAFRVMPYERVVLTHRNVSGSLGYTASQDVNNLILDQLFRYGDANLDGNVDIADFSTLAVTFNRSPKDWFAGDFDSNQTVDISDFALLAANFNQPAAKAATTSVPEPGISSLIFALCALQLRGARRSREPAFTPFPRGI